MRSQFFRIPRQFINFIELLVPAHEVQAHTYGFPLDPLHRNDSSIKPTTGLAAARVDLRGNLASRGAAAPSRHRRDSFPSDEVVGGLFFDFEAVRTERAVKF